MKTWIVVANGGEAHILESERHNEGWKEICKLRSDGNKRSHDIASDRPGRTFSSNGVNRAAIEPHTDPQRYAKLTFAHDIAHWLKERQGDYDKLALVAPPKMLGDLRAALDEQIRERIISELNKDFTHLPTRDFSTQLADVVYWQRRG